MEDEVVSIEHGRADVYDITSKTHRYAAGSSSTTIATGTPS
jgi:hypothetical protein